MELDTLKVVESAYYIDKANFPYVPGYLSFREIPVLMRSFEKLTKVPDAVICDGHGIAHPRGFGLASHVGVLLELPAIGVAKKKLVGEHTELKENYGSISELIYKEKKVGIVFRSREKVKPIYISPGHKVDFDKSLEIVKKTIKKYRLSEPVREAHRFVNEIRKMNS
jgi:deoxyribonuclease V